MRLTSILLPSLFLVACIIALLFMNEYSLLGGEWDTITNWLIILIPSLFGILFGLFILFKRR